MLVFETQRPHTWIHSIDPRVRVATAMGFAMIVCLCLRPQTLTAAFVTGVCFMAAARDFRLRPMRRLLWLNSFLIVLALIMPLFYPGEPWFALGPLHWSGAGVARAGLIALRANAILMTLSALVASMEPAQLGFSLSRLGAPDKFSHLLLFTIRYIEVIHREYHRLRDAMWTRGFRPAFNRHTFRTYGYMVGQMFARSLDRSARVMEAMRLRGFQGRFYVLESFQLRRFDIVFLIGVMVGGGTLAWLEWL